MRTWLAVALLSCALGARAQVASPYAIDIPGWFTETFLDIPEDVRDAARGRKRLLLYFGQDGCPYCKELMQTSFAQRAIVDKTRKHFVAIALNVWGDRDTTWIDGRKLREKELARALRVQFTPTLMFLDEKGTLVARLNGYYPPHRLSDALDYAAGTAGKGQRFDDYMNTALQESASPTLHDEAFFLKPPVDLARKKPVALVFETPRCAGCDELHREGFQRPAVRKLLERFDVYRLTLEDQRDANTTWADSMRVSYMPTIVLFDGGREVFRVESYLRPFHLASALEYAASKRYRTEPSFQRYLQARAERMRERGEDVDLWK